MSSLRFAVNAKFSSHILVSIAGYFCKRSFYLYKRLFLLHVIYCVLSFIGSKRMLTGVGFEPTHTYVYQKALIKLS